MDRLAWEKTRSGRVVYSRKRHTFSERDAARVTREALDYIKWDSRYWLDMNTYALTYLPKFLTWACKFNFLPLESMFVWEWEQTPSEKLAKACGDQIAGYLGIPEWASELAYQIKNIITGLGYEQVLKLKPGYAQLLASTAQSVGIITEDIYGRKSH